MTFIRIIQRDLVFYWRSHIPTMLLAGVCCAILTGAMLVGDSVQYSLRRLGSMRLGNVRFAMVAGDRFFRQELAEGIQEKSSVPTAPVLALRGILESADGALCLNNVNVYGVDDRFWAFTDTPPMETRIRDDTAWVSEAVASRLGGQRNDLLIRFAATTALSQDLIFSTETSRTQAWPVVIAGTVRDESLGRFGLQTQQEAPLNVFVSLGWLAQKAGVQNKANLLVAGGTNKKHTDAVVLKMVLQQALAPEDLALQVQTLSDRNRIELRSPRIFLDAPIAETALKTGIGAVGVFTYFVNEIRIGDKSVPYSTVSAIGDRTDLKTLEDNEIVINEWLADDLGADAGDTLTLTYFKLASTRQLLEESTDFSVRRVVPIRGVYADPTLMPDYPGLGEAENCRDWKPGIPIDLEKIRPKDEQYWDTYKGAPKAFISLAAAQKIWSNRFGTLTAVRWPGDANADAAIRKGLMAGIDPAQVGFVFEDLQAAAGAGAAGSTDFSGLFAGLSMFLIFSAAILLALMFVFDTEARCGQVGLLLATGWGWLRIFALLLAEGAALALVGCAAGAVVSLLYTHALIGILNATFWAKALASLHLFFHATLGTLVTGAAVSFLICVFSIQAALFHRIRRPVHQLLTGTVETYRAGKSGRLKIYAGLGGMLIAAGIGLPWMFQRQSRAGLFFLSGTLLLIGFLFTAASVLCWLRVVSRSFARSQPLLAVRNIPRRTSRSLAVLITLGCGVFLVVSVGSNYRQVGAAAKERHSGTGGFTLLAETTLPMTQLPSLPEEAQVPAILPEAVVGFRVYRQEEASCLNLNRAIRPTLLGVRPEALAKFDAFGFQEMLEGRTTPDGWRLLSAVQDDGTVPAIGDYPTVFWGLGRRVGDRFAYRDESGRVIQLKIVGMLKDSILQGRLLISEDNFVKLFPSVDGMAMFLMDADRDKQDVQARELSRIYRDAGMEVIPTVQKLAMFHEVENTYMAIFLILGGFGLILGSAGLGLVLALNVLDRRAQLAMMQAVGFGRHDLRSMLFMEHAVLLAAGLVLGLIPAALAVVPALITQGQMFPGGRIALIMAALLLCGMIWIRIAVTGVLKMNFLETLKNE